MDALWPQLPDRLKKAPELAACLACFVVVRVGAMLYLSTSYTETRTLYAFYLALYLKCEHVSQLEGFFFFNKKSMLQHISCGSHHLNPMVLYLIIKEMLHFDFTQ